jgi:proteasome lid subunit RPN8/RPN11
MRPQTSLRLVRISREHHDALVAHAEDDAPNECCGYLWVSDGLVQGVKRAENVRHSPYGYELDANSQYEVWRLEDEDGFLVGTYHSHPKSPAKPSQTDINLAKWPDWFYVIVGLGEGPEVRVWWMRDGKVEEEELDVVDA